MPIVSTRFILAQSNYRRNKRQKEVTESLDQLRYLPNLLPYIPEPIKRVVRPKCRIFEQGGVMYECLDDIIPQDHKIWTLCAELKQKIKKLGYTVDNFSDQIEDSEEKMEEFFTMCEIMKGELLDPI